MSLGVKGLIRCTWMCVLETQVILPLLKSDLYATMMECVNGDLSMSMPTWHSDKCAVGVVMASGGYPGSVKKGFAIHGLQDLKVLLARKSIGLLLIFSQVEYCKSPLISRISVFFYCIHCLPKHIFCVHLLDSDIHKEMHVELERCVRQK